MPPASHSNPYPFKNSIYILGAGFSVAAGLPTAADLWTEVLARALPMSGRAQKFRQDLEDYIEFKDRAEGCHLTIKSVNFEEFLGFLEVEHYLGLRGSETWSAAGNESQVIVKTLIGQILTEKLPGTKSIPDLYLDFAKTLQPYDRIVTFNYDIILERACEAVGQRYRLFPSRSGDVSQHPQNEVAILKLHGSLDWFSRRSFRAALEDAGARGFVDVIPYDPIFDKKSGFDTTAIKEPCDKGDDLYDIHRVANIERFYRNPPFFFASPFLLNPSTQKVVYANQTGSFWQGARYDGPFSFRMVVIGYSLPPHDEYARQFIYRLITNYQDTKADDIWPQARKDQLIIVDFRKSEEEKERLRSTWEKSKVFFDGFNHSLIDLL